MSDRSTSFILFKYWIPAILVAILISVFSTQYFAAERTGRIILPILHWLFPWATHRILHLMHVGIRKTAHVTEFGIFSITVFRGVRGGRYGWKFNWALATLVIAVLCGVLDEWHQSFVPLRQATPRDAAIDAFGALLAQCLVWGYATRRRPFTAFFRRRTDSAKNQEEMTG
jgi:VanZ family protein